MKKLKKTEILVLKKVMFCLKIIVGSICMHCISIVLATFAQVNVRSYNVPTGRTEMQVYSLVLVKQNHQRIPSRSGEVWYDIIDKMEATKIEKNWLKRIAFCESTLRENVKNRNSSAYGLLQFMPSTFKANCEGSILNGVDQLRCGLKMYRNNRMDMWECK